MAPYELRGRRASHAPVCLVGEQGGVPGALHVLRSGLNPVGCGLFRGGRRGVGQCARGRVDHVRRDPRAQQVAVVGAADLASRDGRVLQERQHS